jgi:hypothetical protein
MPTFCRHSRLIQNCPICSREQALEMRPIVTPQGQPVRSSPSGSSRSASGTASRSPAAGRRATSRGTARSGNGVTIRQLSRGAEDGYRSALVPGLRSGADAERLAEEVAFAAGRLARLSADPPGLYAEVAAGDASVEERTWLAFLIAYFGPLEADEPFASIQRVRSPWAADPVLDGVGLGPRAAHVPDRAGQTIDAYRAWAARAGSQQEAFTGEPSWSPERRFDRDYERLALPGLHRGARFELLSSLGRLGVYELRAGLLHLGGNDPVTLAAKRILGIADPLLLERRAADLAQACGVPLEALDLGLYNWERGERARQGMPAAVEADERMLDGIRAALGL